MSVHALTIRTPSTIPEPIYTTIPLCEKHVKWMFHLTGLSCFHAKNVCVKWCVPVLINLSMLGACFSPLYYANYYLNQTEVWTTDMVIVWITHSYLLYLQKFWDSTACFEDIEIPKWSHRVSLFFYWMFIAYDIWCTYIAFSHHPGGVLIQVGNTYMSLCWFFLFTTCAVVYYFICAKLLQRAESIHKWLQEIRIQRPTIEQFYEQYNLQTKRSNRFSVNWNFIIFMGFLMLTFHVPIDLISIVYQKNLFDIPGFVIKAFALSWYLFCICRLNDTEKLLISHLYKNRLYTFDDMKMIQQYIIYRPISLNFYGIQINTAYIMKIILLLLNLLIPTLYALLKNVWTSFTMN